jgi:hypothetical protein
MAIYGNQVKNEVGEIGANNQRGTVYNRTTENGWAYKLGFNGGKYSGDPTPTVKLGLYESDASMVPTTRLAVTSGISVAAVQSYSGDGTDYTATITPVKLAANTRYGIGIATSNLVQMSLRGSSSFVGDNESLYQRTGSGATPTNPFSHTSIPANGWIAAWVEYQANRAPTAATSAPSGLITTATPTFTGTFTDADTTYGDKLSRVRIQVTRVSDGVLMWDSGTLTATVSEASAAAFTRAYGGSTLVAGVPYQWRCQVADDFTTWSAWTSYTAFTVNGGGMIVSATSPTGKQSTQQPSPFAATWDHASSLVMTHVQVRIKQGATIMLTGAEVAKAVADNGAVSTTWTEQFGTSSLGWGTSYTWEMRGKDSGGLWGNWSTGVAFSTNNPPDVPYSLAPSQSQPSSSRPLLTAKSTDADGDSVTVKARIKDNSGAVLFTRTMTDLGSGNYSYQTTSTDLATFATYKWDAYSFDGSLYSGAQTLEANATKSTEAAFIYADGPVVTITSPSTTVATASPTVTWTVTDQQKYQVVVTQASEDLFIPIGTVIYDSGLITSTTPSHTIPMGYIFNNNSYDLVVTVTNSAPLTGSSSVLTFTVDYPTPDSITNFTASPEYQQFDMTPSAIRLTWDVSTHPDFFQYYIVRDDGLGTETSQMPLARITSATQTVFVDHHVESGIDYDYAIQQGVQIGLDAVGSDLVHAQARVDLQHVVLSDVTDGNNRAGLHFDSGRGFEHIDDLVLELPWGQRAPTAIYGTAQYTKFSGTFTIPTDDTATAREYITALRNLWNSRATICYRDERGRKFFGKISGFSESDKRVQSYEVDLEFTEIGYLEGVY